MVAEADLAEVHDSLRLRKIGTRSDQFKRQLRPRPPAVQSPEDGTPSA
jgi:hypothetical protein